MKVAESVKCPKCGGQLVYETFGQYGHVRKIGMNGKIHKRYTTHYYGGNGVEFDMIYCTSCGFEATDQCEIKGMTVKVRMTRRMANDDTV